MAQPRWKSLVISQKIKHRGIIGPSHPRPRKESTCPHLSIAALPKTARKWGSPGTIERINEWIDGMLCIRTDKYYLATTRGDALVHAATQMTLGDIM